MEPAALPTQYTVEEYLKLEESSEIRHEFYRGEIFAMSGASLSHNRIIRNGATSTQRLLNDGACEVFLDGAQLKIDATCFLYPDLTISCHPDDLAADRILAHPSVVFEVLSPSSADYDRTSKLRLYQQLPSLRHYVLVRQDYCWVECLTRQPQSAGAENEWTLQVYDKLSDELHLSALSIRVPLTELYARVKLEQPPQIRLR
ncbi:Uma2 family endonuclease [Hymenobacter sp. NST-14]|uniref:Uma2 family endonuclease n=1 Tax=Hymenobacter piscis TaxID=2839984 RepID=UPI001C01D2C3|nr:Uma2 family endonuclease [Hymenobacter piscis]MBT9393473.1 Uma2 family endonuclease [Hymenobacter piscis]